MDMDMSPLRPQTYLFTVGEDAESEDEEEEVVKFLSNLESVLTLEKAKLGAGENDDEDDEDDEGEEEEKEEEGRGGAGRGRGGGGGTGDDEHDNEEEAEEKAPVKKCPQSFKEQEKTLKTPKGPSSVEDIKAKMQVSREKGGFLTRVEARFINYVKNCFQMTDQEVIQDL
ncbi:nucleophosmin-like [Neomonachus schauinslandi]|uniref:Nucleophosmin n=1 Tax=Neomonachus schauinslandi TaxID=29088 RepID=A0A8M1MYX6_NEOSC|nr:nucleophosmin-like [Neomonachus schauinslandi]